MSIFPKAGPQVVQLALPDAKVGVLERARIPKAKSREPAKVKECLSSLGRPKLEQGASNIETRPQVAIRKELVLAAIEVDETAPRDTSERVTMLPGESDSSRGA
jgi:hypothetical protein